MSRRDFLKKMTIGSGAAMAAGTGIAAIIAGPGVLEDATDALKARELIRVLSHPQEYAKFYLKPLTDQYPEIRTTSYNVRRSSRAEELGKKNSESYKIKESFDTTLAEYSEKTHLSTPVYATVDGTGKIDLLYRDPDFGLLNQRFEDTAINGIDRKFLSNVLGTIGKDKKTDVSVIFPQMSVQKDDSGNFSYDFLPDENTLKIVLPSGIESNTYVHTGQASTDIVSSSLIFSFYETSLRGNKVITPHRYTNQKLTGAITQLSPEAFQIAMESLSEEVKVATGTKADDQAIMDYIKNQSPVYPMMADIPLPK